jgi:hypothetical protein
MSLSLNQVFWNSATVAIGVTHAVVDGSQIDQSRQANLTAPAIVLPTRRPDGFETEL